MPISVTSAKFPQAPRTPFPTPPGSRLHETSPEEMSSEDDEIRKLSDAVIESSAATVSLYLREERLRSLESSHKAEGGEPVPEDQMSEQSTPKLAPTPPDNSHEENSPLSLTIDGIYIISSLLRHESHSSVYSVSSPTGEATNLEARAFELDGIAQKLRSHRLRNIKRFSSRICVEVYVESANRTIIVYEADKTDKQDEPEPDPEIKSLVVVSTSKGDKSGIKTTMKNKPVPKPNEKTTHQREIARIRQQERRKANRQKEKQLRAAATDPNAQDTTSSHTIEYETDEEEMLYALLHLAHAGRSDMHQYLQPARRAQLESYMSRQTVSFKNDAEMEAFMMIKYREVLFLRRQLKKLPNVMQRRHDEFGKILREQALLERGSREYEEMQTGVKIAQHRLKAIRNVDTVLPGVIESSDKTYRDLKGRLASARKKKQEIEDMEKRYTEREKLKSEVEFHTMCSKEVVPESGPYVQVMAQLHAAKAKLEKMELKNENSAMILERLKKEYDDMLATPVKEYYAGVNPGSS